jgi:hypothetical protein
MPKVNAGSDSAAVQKFSHVISSFHSISPFFYFFSHPSATNILINKFRCHDAETDHPNEHANRMICGYCSREQVYRPENCGICKAILIGKAGSGFWEGGKGTRNRALMSRKGTFPLFMLRCLGFLMAWQILGSLREGVGMLQLRVRRRGSRGVVLCIDYCVA